MQVMALEIEIEIALTPFTELWGELKTAIKREKTPFERSL